MKVPTPQTPYELGSITKTLTGMLLAAAISKEMAQSNPLARYLPELAGMPAGNVTLLQLATHSSGLPSIPPDIASSVLAATLGANPYQVSVERLISAARTVQTEERGQVSNLIAFLLVATAFWRPMFARRQKRAAASDTVTSFRQSGYFR